MECEQIVAKAQDETASAQSSAQLDGIRVKYLGKKGEITMLMKQMGTLPKEERPAFGQAVNAARKAVEESLAQAMEKISKEESAEKLAAERVDITLPGRKQARGAGYLPQYGL